MFTLTCIHLQTMVIGVGPKADKAELMQIASGPGMTNVFTAVNFAALSGAVAGVASKVCTYKPPVIVTTSETLLLLTDR